MAVTVASGDADLYIYGNNNGFLREIRSSVNPGRTTETSFYWPSDLANNESHITIEVYGKSNSSGRLKVVQVTPTCRPDTWYVYEGDRMPENNCVMTYPVGHDLNVTIGIDDPTDIYDVQLTFNGQIFIDNEPPYIFQNVERNMSAGSNPVVLTALDYCGNNLTLECTVVIEDRECDGDFDLKINNRTTATFNCGAFIQPDDDITIQADVDVIGDIDRATFTLNGQTFTDNTFPFRWEIPNGQVPPGTHPVTVEVLDECGDTETKTCNVIVLAPTCDSEFTVTINGVNQSNTDCELHVQQGTAVSIEADVDTPSDIKETMLLINNQTLTDASAPFQWNNILDNATPGSYPFMVKVVDNCGDTSTVICTIEVFAGLSPIEECDDLNGRVQGIAFAGTGNGYWVVFDDGTIKSYGDASYYASVTDLDSGERIVGITATKSGNGLYLVSNTGNVFVYGDAEDYGFLGDPDINEIVGIVLTRDGMGYYLFDSEGAVFPFGSAVYEGSVIEVTGGLGNLGDPIVALVPTPTGLGYWQISRIGRVFGFGDTGSFNVLPGDLQISVSAAAVATHSYVFLLTDPVGQVLLFNEDNLIQQAGVEYELFDFDPLHRGALTPSGGGALLATGEDGILFTGGDAQCLDIVAKPVCESDFTFTGNEPFFGCAINDANGVTVDVTGIQNVAQLTLAVDGNSDLLVDNQAPFHWSNEEITALTDKSPVTGIPVTVTLMDICGDSHSRECTWYVLPPVDTTLTIPKPTETDTIVLTIKEHPKSNSSGSVLTVHNPGTVKVRRPGNGIVILLEGPSGRPMENPVMGPPGCPLAFFNGQKCIIPLVPGALSCPDAGFGLVDGQCIAQSDGIIIASETCPTGSEETSDGECRKPVSNNSKLSFKIDTIVDKVQQVVFDLEEGLGFLTPLFFDLSGDPFLLDIGISYIVDFVPAATPRPKSLIEKDTVVQIFTLEIETNPCTSEFWLEYKGDRTPDEHCAMSYTEGDDLSVSVGGNNLEEIQEVQITFRDQVFFSDTLPHEWMDIEKNMSPGTYPVSMTVINTCGDTTIQECLIVVTTSECPTEYWFVSNGQRSSHSSCTMTFGEGEDIAIWLGGSNLQEVDRATLTFMGNENTMNSFPFEWLDNRRVLTVGDYPVSIQVVEKNGSEIDLECTIIITDCEKTFQEGHNLTVSAGGDQDKIKEATLFFMDQAFLDTTAPFIWENIATNMAVGSYPLSLSLIDDCDSIVTKECMINIEERTCTSNYWFDYEGFRTPDSDCVMTYPEGHDLSLYIGSDDFSDIQQVTFIFGTNAFVDNIAPFEWIDVATNLPLGSTNLTMIISDKCGNTWIRECQVVIEPVQCSTDIFIDFLEDETVIGFFQDPEKPSVAKNRVIENTSVEEMLDLIQVNKINSSNQEWNESDNGETFEFIQDNEMNNQESGDLLESTDRLPLIQNIPNPFDQRTIIRFYNPVRSEAIFSIFNISGMPVVRHSAFYEKGWQELSIDLTQLPDTGIYFYEVNNGRESVRMKMVMVH